MDGYSPSELKRIDCVFHFTEAKNEEMTKLFEEVGEMSSLKLIWDCKVPENEKSFLKSVSVKSSDPHVVKEEIRKYQKFYTHMKTVMRIVRNAGKENSKDVDIAIFNELYEELTEMAKTAEYGGKCTESKTLYKLHEEFTSTHEKLFRMITEVEFIVLRRKEKQLMKGNEEALNMIQSLSNEERKTKQDSEDRKNFLNEMMEYIEEGHRSRREILSDNRRIMTLLEEVLEGNEKLKRQQELLLEANVEMRILLEKLLKK